MAAILTVDEVREHVETALVDDALQRLINSSDAEIIRKLGALAAQSEVLHGGDYIIHLARAASAITSAVEHIGTQDTSLLADDYNLLADGFRVERLVDGTNPSSAWRGRVTIVYVPADSTAERKLLLVNLVKLELNYTGHLAVSAGDVRIQSLATYADEKASLFRSLSTAGQRLIT